MGRGRMRRLADVALDSLYAVRAEMDHAARPGSADGLRDGVGAPVLLLPGVYETWRFLRPVGERLHALGHPVHVVPGFGYNRGSVPEMAERAQAHLVARDLRGVVVIAHSKGGLIGKHMMVVNDAEGRIARMIAINTPFAGSSYARWARGRVLREFAPTGPTLAALSARRESDARTVSVYSELDPVIPGGSELPGATNIRLPLVGHFRLLSEPLLLDTVAGLLGHGTSPGLAATGG